LSLRTRKAATALAAICAVVAIAPPLAQAGKRAKYVGPVDLPALEPGLVAAPSIEFTVRFTRDGKKLKPKTVFPLKERNVYETCSDGSHVYQSDGPSDNDFFVTFGFDLGVKKGKFSGNDPLSSIEVSGKIQPGGTASGTIRIASHISPPGQPSQDCDTGVLSWTATGGQ
jgi:hypothetical protein